MAQPKIIKRSALIDGRWQEVRSFRGLPLGTPICIGYVTAKGTTGHRMTKVKRCRGLTG